MNASETIGQSLLSMGVYELAVSETLWRLTDAADFCLDVGANVGYMTTLLARKAGPFGKVWSFEPHPKLCRRLIANVEANEAGHTAKVQVGNYAISSCNGNALLLEPPSFFENEGVASLALETGAANASYNVEIRKLDTLLSGGPKVGVMKIDVEGGELKVLEGARSELAAGRIRDIVFEDFNAFPSDAVRLLSSCGYTVFGIGKGFFGPRALSGKSNVRSAWASYEPINYLATVDPERATARLGGWGWSCLKSA